VVIKLSPATQAVVERFTEELKKYPIEVIEAMVRDMAKRDTRRAAAQIPRALPREKIGPMSGKRYEIIPAQFWVNRSNELSQVLALDSLDADLCACVWRFLARQDNPPEKLVVLVITRWPEHPDEPEMFVVEG
jgi:hypothetical protein